MPKSMNPKKKKQFANQKSGKAPMSPNRKGQKIVGTPNRYDFKPGKSRGTINTRRQEDAKKKGGLGKMIQGPGAKPFIKKTRKVVRRK